jgi:hypothetical protein
MKEEANRRWLRDLELSRKSKGTVSNDELAISKVTFEKYREEEAAKAAAVKMSQAELAATFTALRQHIVRQVYLERFANLQATRRGGEKSRPRFADTKPPYGSRGCPGRCSRRLDPA